MRKFAWLPLLVFALAGCPGGGGSGGGGAPAPSGITAPTGVTAAAGNGQVTISWNAITGATSYNLYMASVSGVKMTNYTSLADGMKHAGVTSPFTHTGLTNGTTYYYVVTAVNSTGESVDSAEVSATPSADILNPPTGVSASQGNGQVTISWSNVSGATSYNLYWATISGVTKAAGTKIANATSPYIHAGLTNGTTYYYVVTAVNSTAESGESAEVSAMPQTTISTPAAPANVIASAGFHTLHVSWDAVTNATGYAVYISTSTITTTTRLTPVAVSAPPYDASGLANWQAQHIRISAVNGTVASALSAEVQATPTGGYVVASGGGGAGNFTLDWFHADETDVKTDHLAGGHLLDGGAVAGTGALYVISSADQLQNFEIGFATGTTHTAYRAAAAGHDYLWIAGPSASPFAGTPGRVIIEDISAAGISILSYALTGGDERVLQSGCSTVGNFFLDPHGIAFRCDQSAVYKMWASDGVAPATLLPEGTGLFPSDRSASYQYFFDSGTGKVLAQTIDANPPVHVAPDQGTELLLGVGASRLLVRFTDITGTKFGLETSDLDGTSNAYTNVSAVGTDTFVRSGLDEDGTHELLLTGGGMALLVDLAFASSNANVCSGCGAVDTTLLVPGPGALSRSATGWYVGDRAGLNKVSLVGTATTTLKGVQPGWVLLYNASTKALAAYSLDGLTSHVLSTNAMNVPVIFHPDLGVLWLDADGTTHFASADGATLPSQIDATPAMTILDGQTSAEGRQFYSAERTVTDWDVMERDSSHAQSQTIAGAGAIDERGVYFAQ